MSEFFKEYGKGNQFKNQGFTLDIKRIIYPQVSYYDTYTKEWFDNNTLLEFHYYNGNGHSTTHGMNAVDFKKFLKENKLRLIPKIRTLQGWEESGVDLDYYVEINDYIDEEFALDRAECVCGGYMDDKFVQVGEPYSEHNGYLLYETYKRVAKGDYWKYIGYKYSKYGKNYGK